MSEPQGNVLESIANDIISDDILDFLSRELEMSDDGKIPMIDMFEDGDLSNLHMHTGPGKENIADARKVSKSLDGCCKYIWFGQENDSTAAGISTFEGSDRHMPRPQLLQSDPMFFHPQTPQQKRKHCVNSCKQHFSVQAPRKRGLGAGISPQRKRLRRSHCCHEANSAATNYSAMKTESTSGVHITASNQSHLVQQNKRAVNAKHGLSSQTRTAPRACPHCREPLVETTAPLRHKGDETVPVFTCAQGHMFMRCFRNKQHTELYACTRNRMGKLIHKCEMCPRKKRVSVLCDHCFARFERNTGATSFHPKEDCPHYLAENPHVIKYSHLRQLKSLIAAGVISKLTHNSEYASLRHQIMVEL